jgi:ribosomal protein S6--L-glutamate ligase
MFNSINLASQPTIGMWMYQNSGGNEIELQLSELLKQKGISTITNLDLNNAVGSEHGIVCNDVNMADLACFFSYNAGGQSPYQVYMYEAVNHLIPTMNNYRSFAISEDKFITANLLSTAGIRTPEYRLLNHLDIPLLKNTVRAWDGHVVYKPTDGWGGNGIVKIENERSLDVLIPFLNRLDMKHFYLEKFINYDKTDYRVDLVDGEFVGCYGRQAPEDDWKTNVTSGGSVILREPNDEIIALAAKAAKVTGLEIAGVDLLYDLDAQEYVVLEVNGIPAFATPEQEKQGLNFNQLKIEKIAKLIERKVEERNL